MTIYATIYDLLGRVVAQQELSFANNEATIKVNAANGIYILELRNEDGAVWRERVEISN